MGVNQDAFAHATHPIEVSRPPATHLVAPVAGPLVAFAGPASILPHIVPPG